jgi:type II secretory pathway pseudopilin PulG
MEPAASRRPVRRSGRRALTLLEVLVAIALLLALFGLALPNIMSSLDERAFENAAEMTTAHLLLARAEAQRSARPIEVRYVPDAPRLEARPFMLDGAAVTADVDEEDADTGLRADALLDDEDETVAILPEAWAYRRLPDGVRLTLLPPETPDEIDPRAEGFEDEPPEDEEETAFLLAVYLPDGSVMVGDEVWLRGADGRAGRLRLNAWTGLPSFQRVTAEDLEREREEDDDDTDEDEEAEEDAYEDTDEFTVVDNTDAGPAPDAESEDAP